MKQDKLKNSIIEALKEMPIVQIACKKLSIGRTSLYRWKQEDKEFAKAVDKAIFEGEMLINDLSELQLINLIKDKNFPAIRLWLQVHSKKYNPKVEVTGHLNVKEEPLTPEQEELVGKALGLAGLLENKQTQQNHDQHTPKSTR